MELNDIAPEWTFISKGTELRHNVPFCKGSSKKGTISMYGIRADYGFHCCECKKSIPEEIVTQWKLLNE